MFSCTGIALAPAVAAGCFTDRHHLASGCVEDEAEEVLVHGEVSCKRDGRYCVAASKCGLELVEQAEGQTGLLGLAGGQLGFFG